MKKRDIIIVTICVVATLVCIALTFWGNYKNEGVLTTDAFIGVLATLIGVCATIIVGFQIASFVKIGETEKQIKKIEIERDKMQRERELLQKEISYVEDELSNAFAVLAGSTNNAAIQSIAYLACIHCSNIQTTNADVTLHRYKSLIDSIKKTGEEEKALISQQIYRLEQVRIPIEIEHYVEISKLHIEIIEILKKALSSNPAK